MLFLPPFQYSRGTYHGLTYPGHSTYAVDFNRGIAGDDAGDPIFPSAPGRVVGLDHTYGAVTLDHGAGFTTVYGHMVDIRAVLLEEVEMFELLGRIGHTAPAGQTLSPHLHVQHLLHGRAIPVAYNGCRYQASIATPDHLYRGPEITGVNPGQAPLALIGS